MILLASSSPRRQEILTRLGFEFQVVENTFQESLDPDLSPERQVQLLAKAKAWHYVSGNSPVPHPLLTADTLLSFQGRSLGKPNDRQDAKNMLRELRGHTHFVLTALCLYDPATQSYRENLTTTKVHFQAFSDRILEEYLDTGEWEGAAGSYKIQETGERLVEYLHGSYSNVVGLPISSLYAILAPL